MAQSYHYHFATEATLSLRTRHIWPVVSVSDKWASKTSAKDKYMHACAARRKVSFFTRRGLPKIGGIKYFFLDQKGDQKIF